jgi:hypothetical protein
MEQVNTEHLTRKRNDSERIDLYLN